MACSTNGAFDAESIADQWGQYLCFAPNYMDTISGLWDVIMVGALMVFATPSMLLIDFAKPVARFLEMEPTLGGYTPGTYWFSGVIWVWLIGGTILANRQYDYELSRRR